MTSRRLALVLLAVAAGAAPLAACLTPTHSGCGPESCPGCCDLAGVCQPGSEQLACGVRGAACAECQVSEQCAEGCVAVGAGPDAAVEDGGADGGGEDAGPACGPTNCPGCCQGEVCVPSASQSATVCGAGGRQCSTCPRGGTCAAGACTGACNPRSCPNGCCDDAGFCQAGTSNAQCGLGGQACAACGSSHACQNGLCRGLDGGCDPATCPGCCAGVGRYAACVAGTSDLACGANGGRCDTCNTFMGESCQQGACKPTPRDGGRPGWDGGRPGRDGGRPGWDASFPGWDGSFPGWDGSFPGWDGGFPSVDAGGCGPGTADPCTDGCCAFGRCLPGDSRFACGTGGRACQLCPQGCDDDAGVCL